MGWPSPSPSPSPSPEAVAAAAEAMGELRLLEAAGEAAKATRNNAGH